MSAYCCATDMIEHMVSESKRIFADTTHANHFFFYHDALSLMTARSCREWMHKKGYDCLWILPEYDLYSGDLSLKPYRGRPAGNNPELQSLDSNLNEDTHKSIDMHVRITEMLDSDNKRKFSIATPKRGTHAYLRIFHPVTGVSLSSKRILEDNSNVLKAMKKIVEAKGTVIEDMNYCTGRRRKAGGKSSKWGGSRKRK